MIENKVAANLETLISINADRIKAILIISVAIDHNDWFRQLSPALFEPLTFHVLGFFLLAFTFGDKTWSLRFLADRIARYMIPFWWALTAASLAFFFLFKPPVSAIGAAFNLMSAAFIGNAPFVKLASGLLMLWFLPCLFGLSCLLAAFDSLQTRRARNTFGILAVVAHLAIPLAPHAPMLYFPFGLAVAMDIFALGLLWRQLLRIRLPWLWGPIALVIYVLSYGKLVSDPVHLEVGTLEMAGIDNPVVLALQDLAGVSGVLSVIWLASVFHGLRWFDAIGRHSLLVYLFHPIAYVLLGKLLGSPGNSDLPAPALLLYGCVACCLAVGVALAMSVLVTRSSLLSAWIIPRSWRQWPPARALVRNA